MRLPGDVARRHVHGHLAAAEWAARVIRGKAVTNTSSSEATPTYKRLPLEDGGARDDRGRMRLELGHPFHGGRVLIEGDEERVGAERGEGRLALRTEDDQAPVDDFLASCAI